MPHPIRQPEPAKMFPHRHSGVPDPLVAVTIEGNTGGNWQFTIRGDGVVVTGTVETLAEAVRNVGTFVPL